MLVGGGMGRTHNKENTFARAADHLGFVPKEDFMDVMKAILATQRDHGNRDVRANARMKYLVHTVGIDNFRSLVETYYGKPIQPYAPMPEWKYSDWMGWHEQGDGKLFLGVNVEQGRVKDDGDVRIKAAMRKIVDEFDLPHVLTPAQSVIFKDIDPADRPRIEAILKDHGVKLIEEVDPLVRLAIACPAMPMCGLAITEAERVMTPFAMRMRTLLNRNGLEGEEILMRATGCPNGCARPYMAELAFVGDGPTSYQLWVGGSPVQAERTAFALLDRVHTDKWEEKIEPILQLFKAERASATEAFGDFCNRVGKDRLLQTIA